MLGNMSIQKAAKIMGATGLTRTKHLLQALKMLGLEVGSDKLLLIPKDWIKPMLCIVHVGFEYHWKKHWTLWNGYENCFFDPAVKSKMKETFYDSDRARMLSYLEIKGRIRNVLR